MIKAIAIDDEPLALDIIDSFCNQLSIISLERSFTNLNHAKKYLNKFDIDLLFLDIEMPKTNGIDFFKSLDKHIKVIFTTAHTKYAVEGFKVAASDYLLKPISFERFQEAITRVNTQLKLESNHSELNTHLSIRANYKLYNIALNNILYIEAMDDYVKIYTKANNKPIVARSTMVGILKKLPKKDFARAHKSYIVNLKSITTIAINTLKINETTIPIGSTYKKQLNAYFNKH